MINLTFYNTKISQEDGLTQNPGSVKNKNTSPIFPIAVLLLYLVPAFLYCLYNNLSFINLSNYDPATYYLLLQLRVVITGVVFQVSGVHLVCWGTMLSFILIGLG